jgi:hypothetical protein
MKNLLFIIMMFIGVSAIAQDTTATSKIISKEELSKMGKLTLTKVYLDEVQKLVVLCPNLAISQEDVPDNFYLRKRWRKINKSAINNSKVAAENYRDIIPYSDKNKIIESILYMHAINEYISKL